MNDGSNNNDELPFRTNLEEVNVSFEDTATSRIREDMNLRLKSLAREYLHWNQFIRPNDQSLRLGTYLRSHSSETHNENANPFHLDNWIRKTFSFKSIKPITNFILFCSIVIFFDITSFYSVIHIKPLGMSHFILKLLSCQEIQKNKTQQCNKRQLFLKQLLVFFAWSGVTLS